MFRRFLPVKTKNLFPKKGKWLFLLVTVLLFALVATTAAQEEADDINPPVLEPVMINRTVSPTGVDETWQFWPFQDSFISSARPNNNYGGLSTMGVGYDASFYQAMRMLMQFDLSAIQSNQVVNWARLELYQSGCSPSNDVDMGLLAQYMKASWTEDGVTWNNANYQGGDQIGVGNATCALGWKTFDATNVVREWVSGARTNNGIIVTGHEGTSPPRTRTYNSKDLTGREPKLIIDVTQTCDNVAPTALVEPLPEWSQESFEVRWTGTDSAPSGCEPTGIAYYDVQFNINGGSWSTWQNNVTHTSATFTGAANGQTYQFRARATDRAGNVQSWPSNQTQTRIDTINPSATMNALPEYTMGTSVATSWTGSDNAGGSGIANYDVQFKEDDGDWQNWLVGTTATSATLTNARSNVTYSFRARATDVAGNAQPWSEQAQAVTTVVSNPIAIVLPFEPPILRATDAVTDSFTVNWKGFTVSGVPITEYQVQYRFNNGSWMLWGSFPVTQTTDVFDIPSGNGDGTYDFEARAINNTAGIPNEQFSNEREAFKIVDLEAPFIVVQAYLPLLSNE